MNRAWNPNDDALPFTREEFDRSESELLHKGPWGNADLYLFRRGGEEWVVKDFRRCPVITRNTWGSYSIGRELSAYRTLSWIRGFPQDAFRLHRFTFAYRFIRGAHLGEAPPESLSPGYFEALEALVGEMHGRGIAHLDIRAGKNILVDAQGDPFILDFQSHVRLDGWPRFLRDLFVDIDRSGVYKHWARWFPESLGGERRELLDRVNRLRRFWILKGYLGILKG